MQPPGYNPGESLLQGGNADITPVMGGGGGDSFIQTNPNESLLQGGNAVDIVPLKGGATDITTPLPYSEVLKTPPIVFGTSPDIKNIIRLREKTLSQLDMPDIIASAAKAYKGGAQTTAKVLKSTETDLVDYTRQLPTLVYNYLGMKLKVWLRKNIAMPSKVSLPNIPSAFRYKLPAKGNIDATKGDSLFDRLAFVMPKTIENIVVFEPVKGNASTLSRCLNYINDNGYRNDPNTAVIFSPPFLDPTGKDNLLIFSNFLRLKQDSGCHVYLLAEHTVANIMSGYGFLQYNKLYQYFVNMLEPTYIVYPYKVLFNNEQRDGVIFSAAAENEVSVPTAANSASIGDFILSNSGSGAFAFKANVKVMDTIADNYEIYRFIGKNSYILTNNVIVISMKGDRDIEDDSFVFLSSDKAVEADTIDILLNTGYKIRVPGANNGVTNDWFQLLFTTSEADLLNDLNLNPTMLSKIFGEYDWKVKMVKFMVNLSVSGCFSDRKILNDADCDDAAKFVDKVMEYHLSHDQRVKSLENPMLVATVTQKKNKSVARAKPQDESASGAEKYDANASGAADILPSDTVSGSLSVDSLVKNPSGGPDSRDPFADKVLTKIPFTSRHIGDIHQHVADKNPNLWYKSIVVYRIGAPDAFVFGEISVEQPDDLAAATAIFTIFNSLESRYPEWSFLDLSARSEEDAVPKKR